MAGKKEILQILDNPELLSEVLRISPKPKYQTTTAYFLNNIGAGLVERYISRLEKVDERKPISIQASRRGVILNNTPVDWIKFTEIIDGYYNTINTREKQQNTEPQAFEEGKITVTRADSLEDACRLGAGTSWCIAKKQSGMFQSYRDMKGSTFYFVNDGTQPPDSPLRRVVVDMNTKGILLTDLNNTTGTIYQFGKETKPYFDYLASQGVDISQFVNKPYTEEERLESKKLGMPRSDLNWFAQLTYNEKSKYIGRGHHLTPEQLAYLIQNNANDLIVQYLNSGIALPPDDKAMISHKPQWLNTYLRARKIASNEIYKDADSLEKIVSIATVHREPDEEELHWNLPNNPDYDKLSDLIDSGQATANQIVATGYPYNNPSILKWLIEDKGATEIDPRRIAIFDLDFVKMLINKNIITPEQLMNLPTLNQDIFKWLVLEKRVPIPPDKAWSAVNTNDPHIINFALDSGSLTPNQLLKSTNSYNDISLIKWLVEEKGATEARENVSAYFKDLSILKYLLDKGIITIQDIAKSFDNIDKSELYSYNNKAIMKWLALEYDVYLGNKTLQLARDREIAEWLIDSGRKTANDILDTVSVDPETMKWLITEKGGTIVNRRLASLMASRDREFANIILSKGIVSPSEMVNTCANTEDPPYDFIEWLVKNYGAILDPVTVDRDMRLKRIVDNNQPNTLNTQEIQNSLI